MKTKVILIVLGLVLLITTISGISLIHDDLTESLNGVTIEHVDCGDY